MAGVAPAAHGWQTDDRYACCRADTMILFIWRGQTILQCPSLVYLAVLNTIFNFVLGPPLPRGVPGEEPDCHFPKALGGLWADSSPDRGDNVVSFWP